MHKTTTITLVRAFALAATVGLSLGGCGGDEAEEGGGEGGIVSPSGTPQTLGKQMADANAVVGLEGDLKDQQADFIKLAEQYKEATGQELKGIELTPQEAAQLQKMLEEESDVSYAGLIKEILAKQEKIEDLRAEIEETKARLPMPVVIQRGDTHYSVAMDYLMNTHGLSEAEAKEAISKALITDRLVPGHEVWNFYENGVYGTAVTQGTAKVSPYFLNVQYEKKITAERDHLASELEILEHQRDELVADLEELEQRHAEVVAERDQLFEENTEMETTMASSHYYVDTQANLRADGVVKVGGKRLKDYDPALFIYDIDLRQEDTITLTASAFGKNNIMGAELLPNDLFIKNTDYTVDTSDRSRAVITLHNRAKFENQNFVVVLR